MKPKELLYLLKYSITSWFSDGLEFLSMLKKARTWSYILYGTMIMTLYYRNWDLMWIVLPLVFILYIVRQSKEPNFNAALKDNAFLDNDEQKIKKYYEDYKKQCFFSHPRREPLDYEEYKKSEIERTRKRKED